MSGSKPPFFYAIKGYKNSGKTTLIEQLLPLLTAKGWKVAVIKHDGHDFEGDVPGTDSYRHKAAGAYGTAVFSSKRLLIQKEIENIDEKALARAFPEADIILLEGFKNSSYPGYFCRFPQEKLPAAEELAEAIGQERERWLQQEKTNLHPMVQVKLASEETFFGPGLAMLIEYIDQTGSIQEGCLAMNLSYSKGARIIKKAEKQLGYQLLERRTGGAKGGGSRLTPEGRRLLQEYRQLVGKVRTSADEIFVDCFAEEGKEITDAGWAGKND